jgi:hypothetical protein
MARFAFNPKVCGILPSDLQSVKIEHHDIFHSLEKFFVFYTRSPALHSRKTWNFSHLWKMSLILIWIRAARNNP